MADSAERRARAGELIASVHQAADTHARHHHPVIRVPDLCLFFGLDQPVPAIRRGCRRFESCRRHGIRAEESQPERGQQTEGVWCTPLLVPQPAGWGNRGEEWGSSPLAVAVPVRVFKVQVACQCRSGVARRLISRHRGFPAGGWPWQAGGMVAQCAELRYQAGDLGSSPSHARIERRGTGRDYRARPQVQGPGRTTGNGSSALLAQCKTGHDTTYVAPGD